MPKSSALGFLLALSLLCPPATPQNIPSNVRWAVKVAGRDQRQNKGSNCHSFEYFTDSSHLKDFDYVHHIPKPYPDGINDEVESKRRAVINGFAVYDVVHQIDAGEAPADWLHFSYPPGLVKMVLVERNPGEFCEIFHEQDSDGEFTASPSYFVDVGAERFLAVHDPIAGVGNYFNEAYWTFDKDGPIPLNLSIVKETVDKLLPPHVQVYRGIGFGIETLSYDMGLIQDTDNGSLRQGFVHLTFALKDRQLSIVDSKFDLESLVPISPISPASPNVPHVVIDAAQDEIRKKALAILAAAGYSIDAETASELKISKPYTPQEMARFTQPGIVCQHIAAVNFSPKARATAVTMNSETVCHRDRSGLRFDDHRARDVETMQNTLQELKDKVEGADQRP
jgi:hypothetical protein